MNPNEYRKQYTKISQDLMRRLAEANAGENMVFSPASILILLVMAAEATGGETREEILKVLCGRFPYEDVHQMVVSLQHVLSAQGALSCANGLIVKESLRSEIKSVYENGFRENFDGEVFSSGNLVADINSWVNKKTKGMIEQIADDISGDTLFALINAIAFEAKWLEEYNEWDLSNEIFHNGDKTESNVIMLNSMEHRYIEDRRFTGFLKPYKNGEYSYMALLPKKNKKGISAELLSQTDITGLFENAISSNVKVMMPEFSYSFGGDITSVFKNLGITRLFSEQADFSPFSDQWIVAQKILHKAFIQVDRHGTKAAAVTAMLCGAGGFCLSKPKEVILDRPFIYAIIHNDTGLPVFIGSTNHIPNSSEIIDHSDEAYHKLTDEEQAECKDIYRKVSKWLHPDFNEKNVVGSREEELYNMAIDAYSRNDLKKLRRIKEEAFDLISEDMSPGQRIVGRVMM